MAVEEHNAYNTMDTFGFGDSPVVFYNTRLVWFLSQDLPVRELPLTTFMDWFQCTTHWDAGVSPCTVLRYPLLCPEHTRRIEDADMSYPILVYRSMDSRNPSPVYLVADGNHRLAKAFRGAHSYIRVRILTEGILDQARLGDEYS